VGALEATIAAKKAARPKLLSKLRAAIRALAHERAEVLRKQVTKKQKELSDYAEERAKLLNALEQLTGACWLVDLSYSGPTLLSGHAQMRTGAPSPADRGVLLSGEIDDLRRQASNIEAEAVAACEGGAVSGGTLEELLAAIERHPLAPLPSAVRAWFQQTEAREAARWGEQFPDGMFRAPGGALAGLGAGHTVATPAPRETAYTMVWGPDAVIDRSKSAAVSSLGPLVDGGEVGAAVPLAMHVYSAR